MVAVGQVVSGGGGGPHSHPWGDITGEPVTFPPDDHDHAQDDVMGLAVALNDKAPTIHGHAQAEVTGLAASLAGKAATAHTHAQAEVTGLTASLAGKSDTSHGHTALMAAFRWDEDLEVYVPANGAGYYPGPVDPETFGPVADGSVWDDTGA